MKIGRWIWLPGLAAAFLAVTGMVESQNSREVLSRRPVPADHRLAYGSSPLQFGELRLPKGSGPFPVVVVLHGGCWLSQYGLDYMSHFSADLTAAGVATWSLEYRRLGDEGGGWPGTFLDVGQGIDHLRTLAKRFPLDLKRVVVTGHSAGGHLTLWAAARKLLPADSPVYKSDPLPIAAIVPIAPITDLKRAGTACDREALQLMEKAIYAQVSPNQLLPLGVRTTIVQGETDLIVPPVMATSYIEAARRTGDDPKLLLIENAGHFEVIDPQSKIWPQVRNGILQSVK